MARRAADTYRAARRNTRFGRVWQSTMSAIDIKHRPYKIKRDKLVPADDKMISIPQRQPKVYR